jgi:hypothetical protein
LSYDWLKLEPQINAHVVKHFAAIAVEKCCETKRAIHDTQK